MNSFKINYACFICHTPYHIIQALTLSNMADNNDIYILEDYVAAKDIIINLSKLKRFNNIQLLNVKHSACKSNIKAWKQTLKAYLSGNKQRKLYKWDEWQYDAIIMAGPTIVQAAVLSAVNKMSSKRQVKLYTFDDGAFSYYKNSSSFISIKNQVVRFLFFGKIGMRKNIIHLLYQPQICSIEDKYIKKLMLPSLKKDKKIISCLNTVFNLNIEIKLENKVLVFAGLWQEIYGETGANYLKKILCKISKKVDNNIVIKKHPRDDTNFFNEFNSWEYDGVPAEILFLNISDLESKILITDASTACITPKMLFNQEPIVIMLYRLLKKYRNISQEMDSFFVRIKSSYQNQNSFFIPETLDELWRIFDKIS